MAQTAAREFPASARRGLLTVTTPPDVQINGRAERLTPGARIRGTNNLLVLPASVAGQGMVVNYVRDGQGLISDVWILTEEEAQEQRAGSQATTNFIFGTDSAAVK